MANVQESYPTQTTGLGVAAKISVLGNLAGGTAVPGYNDIWLSVSGATYNGVTYPSTFQLNPQLQDVAGNEITFGTSFVLSSVASSSGNTAVYTGTIGVKANSLVGQTFVVAGFVTHASNNGTFICTANNGSTTITLENAAAVSESASATATSQESNENVFVLSAAANASAGTTVYTGTIGVAANSLVGKTVLIAGFVTHTVNNGTFVVTANNGSTTITVANTAGVAESAASTATTEPQDSELTYVVYPAKTLTGNTYQPLGTSTAIATVSSSGLLTAVAPGGVEVEVSYPTFDNTIGDIVSSGNPMNGLPVNKIFAAINLTVFP
jgi:hypothetical protein